jgi:hypothetical protein
MARFPGMPETLPDAFCPTSPRSICQAGLLIRIAANKSWQMLQMIVDMQRYAL